MPVSLSMPRHPLLSDAQRSAILKAHFHLEDRDIARYWTLSEQDLGRIHRRRRDWNRFGFAVQLCLLRFPGWPPKRQDRIPLPLLSYVGQQLEIPEEEIEDYFRRQPTRSEHLQELIDLYGFRFYTLEPWWRVYTPSASANWPREAHVTPCSTSENI